MRKYSFSSQTRKPLFLASLAVSVALHAGGLYFLFKHPFSFLSSESSKAKNQTLVQKLETDLEIEFALSETLSRLIIKEDGASGPSFDKPRLEMTEQKLNIITNFAYAPKVQSESTPLPFQLEDPSYSISESEEYATLKPTVFGPKKWINFSQRLEIEMEPLAGAPEENEQRPTPYVQPKLEKDNHIAHVQEAGKLPVDVPLVPTDTPYAFNLPKDSVSEIIAPDIQVKKQKTEKKPRKQKKLKVSSEIAKAEPTLKTNTPAMHPHHEALKKEVFDREAFYFFYNGDQISSTPPKLETTQPLAQVPYESSFLPPKQELQHKARIGSLFFASIAPLDVSSLAEESDNYRLEPFHEDPKTLTLSKAKIPALYLPQISSSEPAFELADVDLPTYEYKKTVRTLKPTLAKSFGSTFPTDLPEIPDDAVEFLTRNEGLKPQKEDTPLPKSARWKRRTQIVMTPSSIPFDLSIESEMLSGTHWAPPKQEMALAFSPFSLPETPVLKRQPSVKPLATQDQVTPTREQVQAFAHTNTSNALANQMQKTTVQVGSHIAFAPQVTPACPLIPGQFEVPHAPLIVHRSNWQQVELTERMPTIESHVTAKHVNPLKEEVEQLKQDSSLALDLENVDQEKRPLYKAQKADDLPLSPPRSTLPKQKLSKLPSGLAMRREVGTSDDRLYNNSSMQIKIYEPQEEPLALAADKAPAKALIHPTLPRHLMRRFPEKPLAFDLKKTSVSVAPKGYEPHALASLSKGKMSLSPDRVKQRIYLKTSELAQTAPKKSLAKPKHEPSLPAVPERERTELQIPKLASTKGPLLDLDGGKLSIKEEEIELLKRDVKTHEYLAMPMLPNLKQKKVRPGKAPFKPSKALTDLSEMDTYLAQVPRQPSFPNMKNLLTQVPLPQRESSEEVSTELALAKEIKKPKVSDVLSHSKEIVQKHHEETLAKGGPIDISQPELKSTLSEKDFHTLNESHQFTQGYLSEIPETASLDTVSFQNDFETTVTYVEKPDGNGYHFALKIKPNEKLHFGSPEQNFIFIIDGSGTIKKHRYNTFKDAVVKALGYMHDGDSFNILLADSKIIPMNAKPVTWSRKEISKVRNYLQERNYRGYVANYDTFHLLSKAAEYFDPNKENIVVLLTDGHSFENLKKHKDSFRELAEKNKGVFSLFTASASQGNNITMLDLISTFNNGEFMYSPTNAAFPRKFAVLVKHIESLIAKDIRIHVTSANNNLDVQFYPNQESYPSLYADHPYTLYGSIDKLEDFDLILQGKAGDQWVNIKQRVSFANAEKAGYKLKRNFALQQAYVCYDYYLKKNDPFFLAEAERILSPHDLTPATR